MPLVLSAWGAGKSVARCRSWRQEWRRREVSDLLAWRDAVRMRDRDCPKGLGRNFAITCLEHAAIGGSRRFAETAAGIFERTGGGTIARGVPDAAGSAHLAYERMNASAARTADSLETDLAGQTHPPHPVPRPLATHLQMASVPFAQLVDAISDPLGRLAQLLHGPVGGVALRHVGLTGVVDQPLRQRARHHRLALGHRDERVARPVEPEPCARHFADAFVEARNVRDRARLRLLRRREQPALGRCLVTAAVRP